MFEYEGELLYAEGCEPDTVTWHDTGELTLSAAGIGKLMMRWDPTVSTLVLLTLTAPPFPGGQVMVTLTLVLGMVPTGKPVPVTLTLPPTVAEIGEVEEFSTIAAERRGALAKVATATIKKERRPRTADITYPRTSYSLAIGLLVIPARGGAQHRILARGGPEEKSAGHYTAYGKCQCAACNQHE